MRSICVYCASSSRVDTVYTDAAETLGTLLGAKGWRVINGAGSMGLMRIVSDATMKAGGMVTGIIPHFMVKNGWCHRSLTELVEVETMHERKQRMADMSDAAIALPGGCGTLEELLEIITWRQLGLYHHPVIILNINHYYDPLLDMLNRAADEHFMRLQTRTLWDVAETPREAVSLLETE